MLRLVKCLRDLLELSPNGQVIRKLELLLVLLKVQLLELLALSEDNRSKVLAERVRTLQGSAPLSVHLMGLSDTAIVGAVCFCSKSHEERSILKYMYVLYIHDVGPKDVCLTDMLYFREFDHLCSYMKSLIKPDKRFGVRFDPVDVAYSKDKVMD